MSAEKGLGRVVAALVGAVVSFCVVGGAVFYKVAGVGVGGLRHGGPVVLAGAMAGLFGGGLVAMVVLITALRWGRKGGRE